MRKIFAGLLVILMLAVTVSAQAPFVEDDCGLFSPATAENLEAQFDQLYEEYGFTVSVVTVASTGKEAVSDAAKQAYRSNEYSNDGIMLYICPDEGVWYLYTSGLFSQAVSDSLLLELRESVTEQLQAGNYYEAAQTVCQMSTKPVIEALNDSAAQAEQTRSENGKLLIWGLLGGLMAGIAAAFGLGKLAKKPFPKKQEPEPAAEPVPPVFEVEIPDLQNSQIP